MTAAPSGNTSAARLGKYSQSGRRVLELAIVQRLPAEAPPQADHGKSAQNSKNASWLRDCESIERKRRIEGRHRCTSDNIRADAKPVRIQIGVPGPRLQIG